MSQPASRDTEVVGSYAVPITELARSNLRESHESVRGLWKEVRVPEFLVAQSLRVAVSAAQNVRAEFVSIA
jgi:hypothetical protein